MKTSEAELKKDEIQWTLKAYLKLMLWVLGGIVVVLTILYFIGKYQAQFESLAYNNRMERDGKKIEAERARMLALYKADTFGGATPEETLEKYIQALKKTDVNLASQYFKINYQDKVKADIVKALSDEGNLDYLINYAEDVLRMGKKTCNGDVTRCGFTYRYKIVKEEILKSADSKENLVVLEGQYQLENFDLEKNEYTGVWKIIQ